MKEIFCRYAYQGRTTIAAQCYDHEGNKAVMLRAHITSARDGKDASVSMGVDLSPQKAREVAANLIACADELEKVAEAA